MLGSLHGRRSRERTRVSQTAFAFKRTRIPSGGPPAFLEGVLGVVQKPCFVTFSLRVTVFSTIWVLAFFLASVGTHTGVSKLLGDLVISTRWDSQAWALVSHFAVNFLNARIPSGGPPAYLEGVQGAVHKPLLKQALGYQFRTGFNTSSPRAVSEQISSLQLVSTEQISSLQLITTEQISSLLSHG